MSPDRYEQELGDAFATGVAFARKHQWPLCPGLWAEVTRVWEQVIPIPERGDPPMPLTITDTQQFNLAVHALDKKGNAATVEHMTFASDNIAIATVAQDAADPMAATVKAGGTLGAVSIRFTGDADLSDGVTALEGNFDVVVVGGEAVVFQAVAGVPVEQAGPTP